MARIVFTLEDGVEIETELGADVITVGRHPESIVVLPSSSVSSHHATIKKRGDAYYVQDLGTTNGTKLNGVEVEEAKLEDGDKLTFGDISGDVYLTDGPPAPRAAVPTPNLQPASPPPPPPSLSKRRAPVVQKRSNIRPYEQESSGCAGFLMFLIMLVFAFLVGLHMRHGVETGRFLLIDVYENLQKKVPAVEQAPTAPAPSTDGTAPASMENN